MLPVALLLLAQVASPDPLTLDDAERMALQQSPDLRGAAAAVTGARADLQGQRGLLLPRLHVDGNLQYWGSPYSVNFLSGIPPQFAQFVGSIPPMVVRNTWTGALSLTLSEPLTPLWGAWRTYQADELARDAAIAHLDAAGRDLVFQVRQGYFRLLQAAGNAAIADDSVKQLASHVQVAKQQFEAGTIVKADLLRAEVQLGQARQDLVKAKAAVIEAEASLDALLGRPAGAAIAPVDPFGDTLPQVPRDGLDALTLKALQGRPDLRELELRRRQASKLAEAAWSQLVPTVAVEGQYQFQSGQLFLPENQAFAGLTLSWDIWNWGNTYYAAKSAEARLEQGDQSLQSAELKLRTQVQTALEELQSDHDALAVAAEVVDQAQESFRLETQRYEAQAATATDLLDAQAALSQSKFRLSNARYDYLIALAQLEDLVGEPFLGR